jgi:hypothetical protein
MSKEASTERNWNFWSKKIADTIAVKIAHAIFTRLFAALAAGMTVPKIFSFFYLKNRGSF